MVLYDNFNQQLMYWCHVWEDLKTKITEMMQPGVVIRFSDNQSVLNSLDEKLVGNEEVQCLSKFSISHGRENVFVK